MHTWVKGYFTVWDETDSEGQWMSGAEYMGKCATCGTQVYAGDEPGRAWDAPRILQWKALIVEPVAVYRVKAGDTFWAIARKHGVTVKQLGGINNLTRPDHITVGQEIILPPETRE